MRKPICWTDKDGDGGSREVRVTFHGETVKWQFLPKGAEQWDYSSQPTEDDWKQLESKLAALWQRGHMVQHEMELAKKRVCYTEPPRVIKPKVRNPNLIWKE